MWCPTSRRVRVTELVQLLTPEGVRVHRDDYDVDLTDEELRGLYRDLALARRLDVEAVALQRQGELGLWPSLLGQEAAQVGSGRAMGADDYAFPTYREHGVALTRDVDPLKLLAFYRGVTNGGWDPNEKNFAIYTIVIGNQCLHAVGYAMGVNFDHARSGEADESQAVIAYFGDGASSQGDVNEAFIWASVFNAPVVFFCQNNQWAISEPLEKQTKIPLYQRAQGFGFPGLRVDGNDVLAVLAVTRRPRCTGPARAPARCSSRRTPTGWGRTRPPMTRPATGSPASSSTWKLKDPIERVRSYLFRNEKADQAYFDAIEAEAEQMAVRLRAQNAGRCRIRTRRRSSTTCMPSRHALVDEERAAMAAYLDSFEGASH